MKIVQPHLVDVHAVRVGGDTRAERGLARGRLLREAVARTVRGYADLFTSVGIAERDQVEAATASLDALRAWDPAQHEELAGVAEGAGVGLVDLGRTVARTEILTLATEPVPDECSTVAFNAAGVDGVSVSAQTWDWYARFVDRWHAQRVDAVDGELAHAGFAEYGMTGKIGLNSAGVGVHLNILKHRDDAPGGVPVHALLARLLGSATSVEEGMEIASSAPTTSSSVVTLVGPDRVAMVEIAPGLKSVLDEGGWLLHTNHFLAPDQQDGALFPYPGSTTHDRLAQLERETASAPPPRSASDLLPVLCGTEPGGCVPVLPDPDAPDDSKSVTLVTVRMDPAAREIRLSPGVPQHADEVCLTYRL